MSTALKIAKQSEKWSIEDILVNFDFHWWGFDLHLNEAGVQLLGDVTQWADKITEAYKSAADDNDDGDEGDNDDKGAKIAAAIATVISLYVEFIQSKDKGEGVKLTSPWTMPTLLWPSADDFDDTQLRWTTTDGQHGWVAEKSMAEAFSETGPALAVFRDKLFCVYKGGGDNNHIYWMCFGGPDATDGTWTSPQWIPDVATSDTPALAVSPDNTRLCCVYKGNGNDHLYQMWFDGNNWTTSGSPIPQADSQSGSALALFQDKLFCVYRGGGSNNNIYYIESCDGANWSGANRIPNVATGAGPALAVLNYGPSNSDYVPYLCCVYRGSGGNDNLYWMWSDGNSWTSGSSPIPMANSHSGPALAGFQNKLYCLYRGADDNEHIYHMESSNGTDWNASGSNWIPDVNSYYQPALIVYRQPVGTKDLLLCVHRGVNY
ncbi:hypothetical protein AB4Y89_19930 [Terriglobus sp. 2YAB30_2]|uniref:hypothetical protein n=1 Tax=unclassified Terriglobus TaxID=2628988 RepID=UPI003F9D39E6